MITEIIKTIILLIPAGFANMTPVVAMKFNFLNKPVDFGKKMGGERILGDNKSFRGLVSGAIVSIIVSFILSLFYFENSKYFVLDYSGYNFLIIGFLLGFGALFGDMIKSFFKRRIKIKPGKSWVPFDQIDWIIGALIFISLFAKIDSIYWIISLVIFGILHPLVNYVGFLVKLKKNKF